MKILLTNDDGINAKGIQALINKISLLGEVYVVAPDGERSASSQAITMNKHKENKRFILSSLLLSFIMRYIFMQEMNH